MIPYSLFLLLGVMFSAQFLSAQNPLPLKKIGKEWREDKSFCYAERQKYGFLLYKHKDQFIGKKISFVIQYFGDPDFLLMHKPNGNVWIGYYTGCYKEAACDSVQVDYCAFILDCKGVVVNVDIAVY